LTQTYRTYYLYWYSTNVYSYASTYANVLAVYNAAALSGYGRIMTDGEYTINQWGSLILVELVKGQAVLQNNLLLKYSSNYFVLWFNGAS
jgi:hypothetical protein